MKEGDIVLTAIPQSDNKMKNRPVLLLRRMPGYGDYLACGVSTQIHQLIKDFDELISENDADFTHSGLLKESIIRLGFLAVLPVRNIIGTIGNISAKRQNLLLNRLSKYLIKK